MILPESDGVDEKCRGGGKSESEMLPVQRPPILRLAVVNPSTQDISASSPTDSPTSTLSALSISKWSARGSDLTCASPTTDDSTGAADIEPPPDGGWGVVSSYGVYLAYYLTHPLFPTATPTTYALLGGLNFGTATLCAPFLTILTRRYGPRRLILLGALLQTLSLILASFATETWHLHLTQGVLLGLAVGCAYIPSVAILPQWFEKRRSIAAGIAAAGSGVGGVIFSFATQPLIDHFSLAWSLRAIAVISGSMLLVAALLLRTRNAAIQPRQHGFAIRLLARYDVVLLLGWSFASLVGYIVLLISLSDYAQSIGIPPSRAASITGLVNVGTALGRPFVGALSDRWGRIEVAGVVTAVCGVAVFAVWVPAEMGGEAVVMGFAVLAGATLGTFWVAIGPLCVEVVGLVELPALLSLAWVVVVGPCTVSEVIALKLRTPGTLHPYIGPQVLAGTAYLVAAGIMLELWRVHRGKLGRAGRAAAVGVVDIEEGAGTAAVREELVEEVVVSGDHKKEVKTQHTDEKS
ncbi:hypothetical protein V501_05121 [Pseudogymnoascus sp. VKM F-4519 (FW-2642)]|nr:hypothetical protein V501_05121 [Pseudogymnoascus sp. VKM F-4519 (FW-2642)]